MLRRRADRRNTVASDISNDECRVRAAIPVGIAIKPRRIRHVYTRFGSCSTMGATINDSRPLFLHVGLMWSRDGSSRQ